MQRAIDHHAFPGASVAVTFGGELVALKALGRVTYDADSPPVTISTVYDLASLTKVVATTPAYMILYDRGKLELEMPVVQVLPGFSSNDPRRRQITFRMLLAHSSGLPAYVKLFRTAQSRKALLEQAMQVPLTSDPGSQAEYSDIGFIVLGEALERLSGHPLNEFCEREIFAPLELTTMTFNPPANDAERIPPTVDDRSFRNRIIQGGVNDENAWVMGGVAAHAGCFGTAREVSILAECMLRGGSPLFKPHTVRLFTQRQDSPTGTSRALGWDTPSQPSQSGQYFSSSSYGHLGYTGTSLWIDPERQLSVTLLTNRTWPDAASQGIKEIRPAFHDAVFEALS